MKKALKDLWYMFSIWAVIRIDPYRGGEILEDWGRNLKRRIYKPLN